MASVSNKSQLQYVLQTFERDPQLNICKVVRFYNIPHTTLSVWINGRSTREDIITNSRKLTTLKEEVVIREVLDLNSQRFLSRIRDVEDIANRLLAIYNATYIGPRWVSNFVKRQPKLRIRWNHPYDYQKAQYEDPEIIETWFRLFQNIITKHNIIESDI